MADQLTVPLPRRRFTVDEYERMATAGIIAAGERVQLLDGEIIQMAPIGPPHASTVDRINKLLVRLAGDTAVVRVQNPIVIHPYSEPEPDFVVARVSPESYRAAHPEPDDVLLVVEVADSSFGIDRAVKAPIYARAGIGRYWLVDVARGRVLVYADPTPSGYAQVDEVSGSAVLDAGMLGTVTAADLLG